MIDFRPAAVAALALLTGIAPAAADDGAGPQITQRQGYYVTTAIGGPLTTKQDFDDTLFGKGTYEPDWGLGGAVEVGRYFGDRWRLGVGLSYTRGFDGDLELKDLGVKFGLDGHSDVFTVMVNADYTLCAIDTMFGKVEPFIGGGLGIAHYDVKEFGGGGPGDKTDTAFAGAVHIGYDMALRPGVTLTSRYSVGFTGEAEFDQALGATTTKESEVDFLGFTGIRFDLN